MSAFEGNAAQFEGLPDEFPGNGADRQADDAARRAEQQAQLHRVWRSPSGWRALSDVQNSIVGRWYLSAALVFFLFAGVLGLLVRVQLAVPNNNFLSPAAYNQVFTMHGTVMMFLFAVPIFEAFSILLLPAFTGSRELPFPRLSAYGFWCFLIGGLFVCGSLFFGAAPNGGWFMYPPLTTAYEPGLGADIWLLGLSFIEVSSIAAAVELIVGVLKCRAPGMRVNLMPLYAWYLLVVAAMILFAFPPLIAGDLLFELERALHWPFFDASRGGDPLLWQHLFWIFGHPEVYIIFLPSVALVAMIVPTFARHPIMGYSWIVLSAVGTGFLSFGLWVHHMYTTGLPNLSLAFFSAASEAVAIPTAVQIFCFIATVAAGRVVRSVPMLFVAGALAIFVLGGLTGVMVAIVPFDTQAHDSYFVVAHLHYVLIGGMLFPLVAALYYYHPLITAKCLSERLGRIAFWLMFAGFNIAFLPMHLTGLKGMPRRVQTYDTGLGFDTLNWVSTLGAFVLAAGVAVWVWDLIRPKQRQPHSARNPWNAGTLEWLSDIPGEPYGLRSIPDIGSRYPLWQQPQLMREVDEGRGYLADADEGFRETLVTSPVDAVPEQCLRVPGVSFLPMIAALFTGGLFILPVFKAYTAAGLSGLAALATILHWLWTGTAQIPEAADRDVGRGLSLPNYISGPKAVGWWAMLITMIGDMTAFLSLIFGYFFFWTIHAPFPPVDQFGPGLLWPLLGLALLLMAWGGVWLALRFNRLDRGPAVCAVLAAACGLTVLGLAALAAGPLIYRMDPVSHAYPAIVLALLLWLAAHALVGMVMQGYCLARRLTGRMTARHDADLCNVLLYWHFLAFTALVTVATIAVFPAVSR